MKRTSIKSKVAVSNRPANSNKDYQSNTEIYKARIIVNLNLAVMIVIVLQRKFCQNIANHSKCQFRINQFQHRNWSFKSCKRMPHLIVCFIRLVVKTILTKYSNPLVSILTKINLRRMN